MWSIQLIEFSVMCIASNIRGLKPSELIKLRYFLDLKFCTSVFILISPKIKHFFWINKCRVQSIFHVVKKFT